ncbi:MAG: hypothetical protein LC623_02840, partial [Halobacteriales archaeon]|nr:hypothetical protein [Halobacteriales archaeon]
MRTVRGPWSVVFGLGNVLLLCLASVSLVAPGAAASVATMAATLPAASDRSSAVSDGSGGIYLFGGWHSPTREDWILRYDPAANTLTTLSATLPTARFGTSAVWDGTSAYVLGGFDASSTLDQIVRYTPSTNTVTTLAATLPVPRGYMSAVWDGAGNAYLFGGSDAGVFATYTNEILRYTPSTNTVTTMAATLPSARTATSAVWDPATASAYIFGGHTMAGTSSDQIVRYTPSTGTVTVMGATLPSPRHDTAAAWNQAGSAYVVGGSDLQGQIVRYTPATDTATLLGDTLPSGRGAPAAAWGGSAGIYVFGGWTGGSYTDAIEQVREPPCAPENAAAVAGPAQGEITVTWSAPCAGTAPITGYSVYRSSSPGWPIAGPPIATGLTSLAYTDSGLAGGATYHYTVTATNPVGEGEQSNPPVSATVFTVPCAPLATTASPGPGAGEIKVTWSPGCTGGLPILGYSVYRSATATWPIPGPPIATGLAAPTHTDSGLGNGATWHYTITAKNAMGESPQSSPPASATTFDVPCAPLNLQASPGPGIGQVTLSWSTPSCNGGTPITDYYVYRNTAGAPFTPPIHASVSGSPPPT